jgi:sialate O-acetylesterase
MSWPYPPACMEGIAIRRPVPLINDWAHQGSRSGEALPRSPVALMLIMPESCMRPPCLYFLMALPVLSAASASAAVSVPACFGDHVVLQRDAPIPVWGWAAPGEKVTVQLALQPAVSATAAADGAWKVTLAKSAGGGPFTLMIRGRTDLRISDVLVGDVWLCAGQSNMELTVGGAADAEAEKAAATDPLIRQLLVAKRALGQPDARPDARWTVGAPSTVGDFTACGYFMARELRKQLGVPIGLINCSWGGTRIEPWIPVTAFKEVSALADISQMLETTDGAALIARKDPQQQPTTLYNGMVHGVAGFGLRGAIWYQGEANHDEGALYTEKMRALIGGWRASWGIGDFPFHFVQLAPFEYGGEDPAILPRFWLAQTAALAIANTGMVVTTDIGDPKDIHPRNKQEVGRRLALLALAKAHGLELQCEGPTFKAATPEGGRLRVSFDHASGLATRDGKPPSWFEISADTIDWVKADAVIDGKTVLLSAPQVANPQAARFAWHRNAEPNLMNGERLPAPAFTMGGLVGGDQLGNVPEALGYELVYLVDLARLGATVPYEIDRSAKVGAFDRIGYFLELQREGQPLQYVWAAMDAFTADARKIAVPTLASDATFQQAVGNLTVASNVKDVATGMVADGRIEFWSNDYAPQNSANVPGASSEVFDFGDQMGGGKGGYGCMQVHNVGARQTVFAINQWKGGARADLGIGNAPGKNTDWTFAGNAGGYALKKLRVFVRLKR